MSNQPSEFAPNPFIGEADVTFDPTEHAGDFPFTEYPNFGATELEFDAESDTTELTE